jgi:hypothetical protein
MILDDWQVKFLAQKGDKILCTGRQVGKSVVCAIDAAEFLVMHPKVTVLMIAPLERQAYALFEKTLAYLVSKYPRMILKGKDRPTQTRVFLNNGSKLYCLPVGTGGLSVRFLTIHRLYVDEASRVPADVWTAIQPALLTTGGDSIYLSTPFGKQGEFYKCWINEDEAYNSFTRFSISSEEVIKNRPITSTWTEVQKEKALQKLAQAKARMSNHEYNQEYMGQFSDALMCYFSTDLIKKCMTLPKPDISGDSKTAPEVYLSLPSGDFFCGADIARLGEDQSVIISVSRIEREKIRMFGMTIIEKEPTTVVTKKILELDSKYNYRKIYVDSGGVGGGVVDMLLDEPQTAGKCIPIDNAVKSLDKDDKQHRRLLKEDLYANLLFLMERGKIRLWDDPDLFASLASIMYEYKDNGDMRIFGDYSHCTEALVRACWCIKDKSLNVWCR